MGLPLAVRGAVVLRHVGGPPRGGAPRHRHRHQDEREGEYPVNDVRYVLVRHGAGFGIAKRSRGKRGAEVLRDSSQYPLYFSVRADAEAHRQTLEAALPRPACHGNPEPRHPHQVTWIAEGHEAAVEHGRYVCRVCGDRWDGLSRYPCLLADTFSSVE